MSLKLIHNVKQYSMLLDECLEKKDIVYNDVLFPKDAEEYILKKRLFYKDVCGSRLFFCEEKDFYKLHCYLSIDEDISIEKRDKPQIIECIFKHGSISTNYSIMHKKLLNIGFKKYAKNIRVKAQISDSNICALKNNCIEGSLSWGYPDKKDLNRIYHIWQSLDKYDSTIPRELELLHMINSKQLVVIRNNDQICAVARMKEENRRTSSIWLVAVANEYRNKGIATILYKVIISLMNEKGYKQVLQWCDNNNVPILNTIKKLGFEADGVVSKEYIIF